MFNRESKLYRLYRKLIINNLRRFIFGLYFLLSEILKKHYKDYVNKKILKQLKIQFPIISVISLEEIKFLIHINSRGYIEDNLIMNGTYDLVIPKIADYFIKKNSLIIDVGANLGFYSLYFARKYPDCKVYGYEPVSYIYNSFLKSKDLNELSNLYPYKMAVGANHEELDIYAATQESYNKGTSSIKNNHDINETFSLEKINVVPLNNHLKETKQVSFIKIDVQGFEKDVFEGAWELIKRDRPAIIFEHSDSYYESPRKIRDDIAEKFAELKYNIYCIRAGQLISRYCFLEAFDFSKSGFVAEDLLAISQTESIPANFSRHKS